MILEGEVMDGHDHRNWLAERKTVPGRVKDAFEPAKEAGHAVLHPADGQAGWRCPQRARSAYVGLRSPAFHDQEFEVKPIGQVREHPCQPAADPAERNGLEAAGVDGYAHSIACS
jgi:hypothetical protein